MCPSFQYSKKRESGDSLFFGIRAHVLIDSVTMVYLVHQIPEAIAARTWNIRIVTIFITHFTGSITLQARMLFFTTTGR